MKTSVFVGTSLDGFIAHHNHEFVQRFLCAKLIQRLVNTRVPVLIGAGIPLFGALSHDVRLEHLQTTTYKSGLVKSEYEVLGA